MRIKSSKVLKLIALALCFLMAFEQSGFAQVAGQLDISGHLAAFRNSIIHDKFRPLHLRYLQYDPQLSNFRVLLDKGNLKTLSKPFVEQSTKTLLQYFLVGVTLSNDAFWVNLRPDSPDNIIDPLLAQTDVGKILLEADVQLKKDTAKFTSPETPEGKEYWDKLYQKAGEVFGSQNVTIPTLTRPWIVPNEIIIRESSDNAYIYKATLKVMLEDDYLKGSAVYNFKDERLKELNVYASQVLREKIIPKLTQEINTSKRYAALRQVYYSLILAQWFKQRFYGKNSIYSNLINRNNLAGLVSKESWSKNTYFNQYQKSFKDGEYNFKVPVSTPYGQTIRSYFSGGADLSVLGGPVGASVGLAKGGLFTSVVGKISDAMKGPRKYLASYRGTESNGVVDDLIIDSSSAAPSAAAAELTAPVTPPAATAPGVQVAGNSKSQIFDDLCRRFTKAPWNTSFFGENAANSLVSSESDPSTYENVLKHIKEIRAAIERGELLTDAQIELLKAIEIHHRLKSTRFWQEKHTLLLRIQFMAIQVGLRIFPAAIDGAEVFSRHKMQTLDDVINGLELVTLILLRRALYMSNMSKGGLTDKVRTRINDVFARIEALGSPQGPRLIDKLNLSKFSEPNTQQSDLQQEVLEIGREHNIMAHGVELGKGGLRNLLNIILEGQLREFNGHWYVGELSAGDTAYTSGHHGPYYAVLNEAKWNHEERPQTHEVFAWYLVPSESEQSYLREALSEAVKQRVVGESVAEQESKKIITYQEFIQMYSELAENDAGVTPAGAQSAPSAAVPTMPATPVTSPAMPPAAPSAGEETAARSDSKKSTQRWLQQGGIFIIGIALALLAGTAKANAQPNVLPPAPPAITLTVPTTTTPQVSVSPGTITTPSPSHIQEVVDSLAKIPHDNRIHEISTANLDNPTILCIHGAIDGELSDHSGVVKEGMENNYNIYGFSYKEGDELGDLARHLREEFIRAGLGKKRVVVVANSYGYTLLRTAFDDYPELSKNLVIISAVPLEGGSSQAIGVTKLEPMLRQVISRLSGVEPEVAANSDPLGPTAEALFSDDIDYSGVYIIKVAQGDQHVPGNELSPLQRMLVTRADLERFGDLSFNALEQVGGVTVIKVQPQHEGDTAHDAALDDPQVLKSIFETIETAEGPAREVNKDLRPIEQRWADGKNPYILFYTGQWIIEALIMGGAIILTIRKRKGPSGSGGSGIETSPEAQPPALSAVEGPAAPRAAVSTTPASESETATFLSEAISLWSKWNEHGDSSIKEAVEKSKGTPSENGEIFVVEGNQKVSSLLEWQTKTFWEDFSQLPSDSVRSKVLMIVRNLAENVEQHGNKRGVLFLRYDRAAKKAYVAVLDKGSGWQKDQNGQPLIIVDEHGKFLQGSASDGDGIALGQIRTVAEDMQIFTGGYRWRSEDMQIDNRITGLEGTLAFVVLSVDDSPVAPSTTLAPPGAVQSADKLLWYNRPIEVTIPQPDLYQNHAAMEHVREELLSSFMSPQELNNVRNFDIDEYIEALHILEKTLKRTDLDAGKFEEAMLKFFFKMAESENRHKGTDGYSDGGYGGQRIVESLIRTIFSPGTQALIEADPLSYAVKAFIEVIKAQAFHNGNHRVADFILNFILLKSGQHYFGLNGDNLTEYYRLFNTKKLQAGDYSLKESVDFFKREIAKSKIEGHRILMPLGSTLTVQDILQQEKEAEEIYRLFDKGEELAKLNSLCDDYLRKWKTESLLSILEHIYYSQKTPEGKRRAKQFISLVLYLHSQSIQIKEENVKLFIDILFDSTQRVISQIMQKADQSPSGKIIVFQNLRLGGMYPVMGNEMKQLLAEKGYRVIEIDLGQIISGGAKKLKQIREDIKDSRIILVRFSIASILPLTKSGGIVNDKLNTSEVSNLNALRVLNKLGYPVVMVDAGRTKEVVDRGGKSGAQIRVEQAKRYGFIEMLAASPEHSSPVDDLAELLPGGELFDEFGRQMAERLREDKEFWNQSPAAAPRAAAAAQVDFKGNFIKEALELWKKLNNSERRFRGESSEEERIIVSSSDKYINSEAAKWLRKYSFDNYAQIHGVIEALSENIQQHGDKLGLVFLRYDRDTKKVYIAVMDKGPGWEKNGMPKISNEKGGFRQREGSPGVGHALGYTAEKTDLMEIYTRGFHWTKATDEMERADEVEELKGALVFVTVDTEKPVLTSPLSHGQSTPARRSTVNEDGVDLASGVTSSGLNNIIPRGSLAIHVYLINGTWKYKVVEGKDGRGNDNVLITFDTLDEAEQFIRDRQRTAVKDLLSGLQDRIETDGESSPLARLIALRNSPEYQGLVESFRKIAIAAKKARFGEESQADFSSTVYAASGSDVRTGFAFGQRLITIDINDLFDAQEISGYDIETLIDRMRTYIDAKLSAGHQASTTKVGFAEYLAELILMGVDLGDVIIRDEKISESLRKTTVTFSANGKDFIHVHFTGVFTGKQDNQDTNRILSTIIGRDVLILSKAGALIDGVNTWLDNLISNRDIPVGSIIVADQDCKNPQAEFVEELTAKVIIGYSGKTVYLYRKSQPGKATPSAKDTTGGIDFRAMPTVVQPMAPSMIKGQTPGLIPSPRLDKEWSQIENMLNGGITPSIERLKDYLAASCKSPDCQARIDQALSGIADILRLEEENSVLTESALKQLLILLESNKPAAELQSALAKIQVAAKTPQLATK